MKNAVRIRAGVATAVAVVGLASPFLFAGSADALGNNRAVTRSCGTNWVASGKTEYGAWAETDKNSGNCTGVLSAALERSNGTWSSRTYGTTQHVWTFDQGGSHSHGLHWGCNNCAVTRS